MTPKAPPSFRESCVPRIGLARLTRMAFEGADLWPLWDELMERATDDAAGSGMAMDLSVIAQLRGDKETGLAIQCDTMAFNRLYRSEIAAKPGALRVLALAAASDIGANTPIEFLVQGGGIELAFLYLVPGHPLPDPLPAHDVAVVVAPASADGEAALAMIEAASWATPLINAPTAIRNLERDRLYQGLQMVSGLHIPATLRLSRARIAAALPIALPVIIRPLGSHAGFGLARIATHDELRAYLESRPEEEFFVSPYIDYASGDGQFRKYRIALIDGKPYPVHMAIAEEWKVWYLNADMALNVANRAEEAAFMEFFEQDFAARHRQALDGLAAALGLDYVLIDCAETRDGKLLVFEADHCALVHDMDPANVYPYKPPQMRKIFQAFAAMLERHGPKNTACAA